MSDPFDLQRFLDAQNPVYESVCDELLAGRKQGHWIWFIFPQLRGLGSSPMADRFGISSRKEAEAYFNHPVLGPRLIECTRLVNLIEASSVDQIFGYPDNLKFRSSITLFQGLDQAFGEALQKYFSGEPDPRSRAIIDKTNS